jgi:hypothetical protein
MREIRIKARVLVDSRMLEPGDLVSLDESRAGRLVGQGHAEFVHRVATPDGRDAPPSRSEEVRAAAVPTARTAERRPRGERAIARKG